MKKIKHLIFPLALLLVTLAIDLVSKALVMPFLYAQQGRNFVVSEGVFTLQYARNPGAALGIFSGQTTLLLSLTISVAALILAFIVIKPKLSLLLRSALALILSGALGNIICRITQNGYVRDFIRYDFIYTVFGINFGAIGNIADIFVMIGAAMMIYYVIFDFDEEHFKGWIWNRQNKSAEKLESTSI